MKQKTRGVSRRSFCLSLLIQSRESKKKIYYKFKNSEETYPLQSALTSNENIVAFAARLEPQRRQIRVLRVVLPGYVRKNSATHRVKVRNLTARMIWTIMYTQIAPALFRETALH